MNDFLSNDLSPKNYASNLHYLCKPTPFSWHAFFLVYHFMFRASFFLVVLLCTCFWSLAASSAIEPTSVTPQPNILMIYADDLGYETLQCYDGLDFTTPKLDAMAAEGVRFNRAYASPVCTPSRVSLLTGLYPFRHSHHGVLPVHKGTHQKVDFGKMPTFPQLLRANGYTTSVTGKWQLATLEVWPNHIRNAGFDSWCVWQIWRDGEKTSRHWNPTFNEDGQVREDIQKRFGPDVLVDYVIEQMAEAQAAKQPFLIIHNELLPHDPIVETPEDRRLNRQPRLTHMVGYLDQLVGRLLDAVERLGIRDNTYVVFMGDNGTHEVDFDNPKFGQPGERKHTRHTRAGNVNGGKFELNDAGTHVPLIVWGPPSVPRGQVCDDLVDVVDLFPTYCELTNTAIPESLIVDGRSIVPQIQGQTGELRPWVHHAISGKGESLFDGSWRAFSQKDQLWDARQLPAESPAAADDERAESARARLEEAFQTLHQNTLTD
ncbi:sulfatase-like hydrolase/transferase [Rhodopirellula europaea]|uniref:N-acetylgalactosamine 6-sulfate sulfatase (GALNS) n=1 Tax=Rhodopirellula europaea SH398 TaxID=1263868 RepID=M5SIQ5_9BACT|nr:sulfatase-like hydrolase/transferase [Rhodopirellula europaea]EMI26089.1 N-acetylgalactosamine 6-sulfate sulfatase (GALNS) [Rhodopirellula europaea SH398]